MNPFAADPNAPDLPVALVVEDDAPLLELATQILERAGYRVLRAASAEEAEALAVGEELALLFTDVVLPGRSGLDLARSLAGAHPDLPVLITTGQWDRDVRRAVEAAGHHVLRKPYTAPQVVDAALAVRAAVAVAQARSDDGDEHRS